MIKTNYFSSFQKYIENKGKEYQNVKNNTNVEIFDREIDEIHQIMKENIILITNRDRVINSINLLSKSTINHSERFKGRVIIKGKLWEKWGKWGKWGKIRK